MKKAILILIVCLISIVMTSTIVFALVPDDHVVQVTAVVQELPAKITLSWQLPTTAVTYHTVYRKTKTETSWGNPIALLGGTATGYEDINVTIGYAYEYKIETDNGYGYVFSGISVPAVENRGKVILIVDNTYSTSLSTELNTLNDDLIGDGWTVLRHDVSRSDTIQSIKSIIQADYNSDPTNVKSVFLLGHVPICKSGYFGPDGHGSRAWAADSYYGDMDGLWTDSNSDGVMDQSYIPSNVELQVGRVDMLNLTAFAPRTDTDLIRDYLNKEHNYRTAQKKVAVRSFVFDAFLELSGEAPSQNGLRTLPLTGSVSSGDWHYELRLNDYIWVNANGGGSYTTLNDTSVTTNNLVNYVYKAQFAQMFGSYFGEWDHSDDLMRAFLAMKEYGLSCVWAGRPNWFFHHMGIGETLGYSTKLTMNNTGLYMPKNSSPGMVHIGLMGDPTLRMYPVTPPTNVSAPMNGSAVEITWLPSTDPVLGYYVYKATSPLDVFQRVTPNIITQCSYVDSSDVTASTEYMIRAIKLETTPSGSFYNLSQGTMINAGEIPMPTPSPTPMPTPTPEPTSTINAVVINETGEVAISGNILNGGGDQITIKVNDPSGKNDYFDQITTGTNGEYLIKYRPHRRLPGSYNVILDDMWSSIQLQASFIMTVFPEKAEIGKVIFTDTNGEAISSLTPNTNIYGQTVATNNTGIDADVTIIVALYNSNGKLINLSKATKTLPTGTYQSPLQAMLILPEYLEGGRIKAFIWDSVNGMRSLTNTTLLQ
jgi:hypothetical protein